MHAISCVVYITQRLIFLRSLLVQALQWSLGFRLYEHLPIRNFYVRTSSFSNSLNLLGMSTNLSKYADATVEIAVLSNIENGLGITAASLATIRPLLRHIKGELSSTGHLSEETAVPLSRRTDQHFQSFELTDRGSKLPRQVTVTTETAIGTSLFRQSDERTGSEEYLTAWASISHWRDKSEELRIRQLVVWPRSMPIL